MDAARYAKTQFGSAVRTVGAHGYVTYVPNPLPRHLEVGSAVVAQLADAESALGRLAGAGRLLPDPLLLARPFLQREAVASTRIEGTQVTHPELFELTTTDDLPNADLEETLNYVRALNYGVERVDQLPLSTRLVRELHELLLAGVRGRDRAPGQLRRSQNWVGHGGASIQTAEFVPPPFEMVGDLLSDWERYIHEDQHTSPLIECALLHYQFETIHPFLDGNGRMGRLLIVLILMHRRRLPAPLLYLSPWFEQQRDQYYQLLQGVRERGDLDAWLLFFLQGVERQSADALARAERLVDLREQYRGVAATIRGQTVKVVDLAFERPMLTTRLVEQRLDVSKPTAMRLLTALADHGVLTERPPGQRGRRRWAASAIIAEIIRDEIELEETL